VRSGRTELRGLFSIEFCNVSCALVRIHHDQRQSLQLSLKSSCSREEDKVDVPLKSNSLHMFLL